MTNITWRLLMALVVATPLAAQARPAGLSYVAPPGCPSREAFIASIETRGGDVEALDTAIPARAFSVVIRREGEGYVGTLTADVANTAKADDRTLRGATCGDVADALSVTLALELRPKDAASEPQTASSAATEPPPTAPAAEPAITSFRAASSWGHNVAPVGDGKLHFDPKFAVMLSAGVSYGLLPSISARYDATFRMANFVTLPNGEQSIVGPILRARLGFVGSPQGDYKVDGSTISISGQSAGLGLCWSPHYDATGLVLLACGELGLAGYATHVEDPSGRQHDSPITLLGSLGPVLEAEYSLGHLQVGAKVGGNLLFGTLDVQNPNGEHLLKSRRWDAFLSLGLGGHW